MREDGQVQPKQAEEVRRDVVSRALLKAAELIGGLTALQVYLDVDRARLFGWIVGKGTPPEDTFVRVVEILIEPRAAQDAAIAYRQLSGESGPSDEPPPPE